VGLGQEGILLQIRQDIADRRGGDLFMESLGDETRTHGLPLEEVGLDQGPQDGFAAGWELGDHGLFLGDIRLVIIYGTHNFPTEQP
jgi:hypothetical protein